MFILLKYTFKTMWEKKFRTFLIVLAIALGGGLFIASMSLTDSIMATYTKTMKAFQGDVDFSISPDWENDKGNNFAIAKAQRVTKSLDAIVPMEYSSATYQKNPNEKMTNITIVGYNIQDYMKINEIEAVEGNVLDMTDQSIILSKKTADELGIKAGETVTFVFDGKTKRKLKVAATVKSKGVFIAESQQCVALMPYDTIAHYNRTKKGKTNSLYIKVANKADKPEIMNQLTEIYSEQSIRDESDFTELASQLSVIQIPFVLMTFVVVFMSVFIIYSSFKVIMLEKLPHIGTFRSVGASKKKMNRVLMLESILYGTIGGICGVLLGKGFINLFAPILINMMMQGIDVDAQATVQQSTCINGFILCEVIAIGSTIIPIKQISKMSLKDVILGGGNQKEIKYFKSTLIGVVLIVAGLFMVKSFEGSAKMIVSVLGMLFAIIGIIKVVPILVAILSEILSIIFKFIFGNVGFLASKNLKQNKSVLNSITLITIGISILIAIGTMTSNVETQVVDFYDTVFNCDIEAYIGMMDKTTVSKIKAMKNVKQVVPYANSQFTVKEFNNSSAYAYAADLDFVDAVNLDFDGDPEQLMHELYQGRNVIVNNSMKRKYNLKKDDVITVDYGQGKKAKQFKIVGFYECQFQLDMLMPLKYYKMDMQDPYYGGAYIKLYDHSQADALVAELEEKFADNGTWIRTIAQQKQDNMQSNAMLMGMISVFGFLAALIGVVGIINNLMVSFIERKKQLGMMRSVGMSKWQLLRMIFIEGLGSGLCGAIGGVLGGMLVCIFFGGILEAMESGVTLTITPSVFPVYFIGGMLVTVIGSIIPARGGMKLDIVSTIKCD